MLLTFIDRLDAIKAAAIDQIRISLAKCEGCEYKILGTLKAFREDTMEPYRLKHVREERGKVYVLGEHYWEDEEYDFEIAELDDRNIAYLAIELINL